MRRCLLAITAIIINVSPATTAEPETAGENSGTKEMVKPCPMPPACHLFGCALMADPPKRSDSLISLHAISLAGAEPHTADRRCPPRPHPSGLNAFWPHILIAFWPSGLMS